MKIDDIEDIKFLRDELKKRMVKCIKTYRNGKEVFNEGEYYDYYIEEIPYEDYMSYQKLKIIGNKKDIEINDEVNKEFFKFYE